MDTDLSGVVPDFDVAQDMKNALMRLVEEQTVGGSSLPPTTTKHQEFTPDGRKLLIFFPTGLETLVKMTTEKPATDTNKEPKHDDVVASEHHRHQHFGWQSQKGLHFVVFVGYKKPGLSEEKMPVHIWEADDGLKKDMSSIPEILAYVSCERSCGGDWSNFVLFTAEDVVERWQACRLHAYLVTEFSPIFYSTVRIHRGRLEKGLFADTFCLERTLFLDYTVEASGEARDRHVIYWNRVKHKSPVPWVTVKSQPDSAETS